MKKLFFIILVSSLCSLSLFSQSVNNVLFTNVESEFITVIMSTTVSCLNNTGIMALGSVVVDFGNGMIVTNSKRKNKSEAKLRDANGRPLEIISANHALNLLVNSGYELIENNVDSYAEGYHRTTYLLSKKHTEKP